MYIPQRVRRLNIKIRAKTIRICYVEKVGKLSQRKKAMQKEKLCGAILLVLPVLIIIGFLLNNEQYWIGVDIVAFFITVIIGLFLIKQKK
jgi:hypothetical protein